MCGIVGYIGKRQVFPILIKGLKRLEYRGYDSAGVAMINDNGDLSVYKTKGKVVDLERFCEDKDISGTVGIAHTRWATHGEPSSVNAHPHYSESKNIAIIHNGIIENYADLKKKLVADGVKFRSDTDTEVIVQLIEYIQTRKNVDLLTAVRFALTQLIGAYAIAVLDKRDKDQIIAARKQSPLVIGIGEDEFFLGSDATPIIEYTDKVVYLDDDNIAVIRRGEDLKVVNTLNDTLNPEICTVDLDLGQIEKGVSRISCSRNLRAAGMSGELHAWKDKRGSQQCYTQCCNRLQTSAPCCQACDNRCLRHVMACRTHRQAADRVALPHTGGSGIRQRVQIQKSCYRQYRRRDSNLPER